MTEQRKKLIDKFQSWLDTDPRKQIIADVCANIAEEYADEQLRLHLVSQQRELFLELLEFVDNDLEQTTCEWLNEQFVDEFINSKNCGQC